MIHKEMIRLAILDFDGTLADTRELIVVTNQEVQRRMGYPVLDEAAIVATIGLPLKESTIQMFPDLPLEEIPAWISVYREVFESLRRQMVPDLFPHVRETLEALSARGCIFSVASSRGTTSLQDFLKEMGIAPYISYVLGADDVKHAKPHPEPVLTTLRDLSIGAGEALVVGDMPVDIRMGLSAGAWTCGVSYGNSDREALLASGANYVIDDFAELSDICK